MIIHDTINVLHCFRVLALIRPYGLLYVLIIYATYENAMCRDNNVITRKWVSNE